MHRLKTKLLYRTGTHTRLWEGIQVGKQLVAGLRVIMGLHTSHICTSRQVLATKDVVLLLIISSSHPLFVLPELLHLSTLPLPGTCPITNLERDTGINGNDLSNSTASSAEECVARCYATPVCTAVVFNVYNICWLKACAPPAAKINQPGRDTYKIVGRNSGGQAACSWFEGMAVYTGS